MRCNRKTQHIQVIITSTSRYTTTNNITMKLICTVLVAALSCVAAQRPFFGGGQTGSNQNIPIVAYNNEINPDGSYRYNYETGNGIAAQEQGYLKNPGQKDLEAQVAQGSFSYTGPDGVLYTITYTADENGFVASGAHLPTPPPIPEAILKSLQLQGAGPSARPAPGRFFRK